MSKKNLAVALSKLKPFAKPKQSLEQYTTDSEIGSTALWIASMKDWIKNKTILDLGAGTGLLGIGCLLLGAKKVIFVEKDTDAIKTLTQNIAKISEEYEIGEYKTIESDIQLIEEKADLVVMNPPFGTVNKGSDTLFVEKAMTLSNKIITFHKTETTQHIESLFKSNNFKILEKQDTSFPLKMSLPHHKKHIERIKVSLWIIEK